VRQKKRTTEDSEAHAPAAGTFEDALLVRQVQGGAVHVFAELVRKYQDRVYNACLRICHNTEDARDLTQEAFLKAFASIDQFRGKSAFFTWIFRIAVNLAISQQRKRQSAPVVALDAAASDEDATSGSDRVADTRIPDPAERLATAETRSAVLEALQRLEPDYRVVLVLRDMEGFDYQAIADVLETRVGTVKSRIFRARMALKAHLDAYVKEESA